MSEAPSTPVAFEERLKRLEAIVARMEGEELSLEEALRLFEEGTRLARELHATLESAEQTIQTLLRRPDGGHQVTPFEPGEEA